MSQFLTLASPYRAASLLAFVVALASHQAFRTYEPTISSFTIILFGLQTTVFCVFMLHGGWSLAHLGTAAILTALFSTVYLATLSLSVVLYRVYFHPLQRYPGPKLCRISKFEWFFRIRAGHFPQHVDRLHQKYGDVVRIGPNDLAFCDPSETPLINGPSSKMEKGPHMDGSPWANARSVTFVRNRIEHRGRRRIWDQGFTTASLQQYESRIAALTELLAEQFVVRSNQVINMADWTSYFAFDAMGELGFGIDFGMVKRGEAHMYRNYVQEAMRMRSVWIVLPWCKYIVKYLPMDNEMKARTRDFVNFGNERFEARRAQGTVRPDVFSHLLAHDKESGGKLTDAELREDCKAIILAGSDTTSFALAALFFALMENPSVYAKLQKEVDELNEKGPIKGTTIGPESAPYISGVLNEVLRVYPPAAEPMQRTYGNSPWIINGKPIPSNTNCYVSTWTLHHDDRNFSQASSFVPERWIDSQRPVDFNHNSRAFLPFGSGLYNCVGRTLAQLEMRQFIATILYRCHFEPAPTYDAAKFRASLKSFSTMSCGELPLLVTTRDVKC